MKTDTAFITLHTDHRGSSNAVEHYTTGFTASDNSQHKLQEREFMLNRVALRQPLHVPLTTAY